jgi:hypothetical protein
MTGKDITKLNFSALELKIAALSGVGRDLHRERAAELFGVEPSAVTAEQRRFAKAEDFHRLYSNPSVYHPPREQMVALFEATQTLERCRQQAVDEQRNVRFEAVAGVTVELEYNPRARQVTHGYYLINVAGRMSRVRRRYSDVQRDLYEEFMKEPK